MQPLEAWRVEEWREKRLRFMYRLYDATGGSELADVDRHELGDELGLSSEETDRVIEYLKGEQLLAYPGLGGISITHRGVLEVERSISNPKQETEHFPPAINVIHIGEMHGSQIQQGTVQSQQRGEFLTEADREPLRELVNTLRAVLPEADLVEEDRRQAEAELGTVEAQLNAPKPKRSFIRVSLESVRDLIAPIASLATRSAELTQAVEQLHRQLPGI
jgi:hypothetical protein